MEIYEYLKEFTFYVDGKLYWAKPPRQGVSKGSEVGGSKGFCNNKGYRQVNLKGKMWLLHRLIYIFHHKEILGHLDHIDRNPLNNQISNLRDVTRSQNQLNRDKQCDNTSGYKGVWLDTRRGKWAAEITINKKKHWLGYFLSAEEASAKYQEAYVLTVG